MSAFGNHRVKVKGKKVIVRTKVLRRKVAEFERKEDAPEEPKK
jgi:hypothetical protein